MFSIVLPLQASKPFVVENVSLRKRKPTTICADSDKKKSNGDRVREIFKFAGWRRRGSRSISSISLQCKFIQFEFSRRRGGGATQPAHALNSMQKSIDLRYTYIKKYANMLRS